MRNDGVQIKPFISTGKRDSLNFSSSSLVNLALLNHEICAHL